MSSRIVRICQCLLALAELGLQGRARENMAGMSGSHARHPELGGFGGSSDSRPRRNTTPEHTTCEQKEKNTGSTLGVVRNAFNIASRLTRSYATAASTDKSVKLGSA